MMETDIEADATHLLISSDRVEGTAVYDPQGSRLGTVSSLMIDKASGQVEYAIMAFGGLFGLGSDHYPIPWAKLAYDHDRHGYVVDLDRERLLDAPRHGAEAEPAFSPEYYAAINGFYGGIW